MQVAHDDVAVEYGRLEIAAERHDTLRQLEIRDAARNGAGKFRPAQRAAQQRNADRAHLGIESQVHLVGAGVTHAQRLDREPAVEDRNEQRLEQPEVTAGGREWQLDRAELDAPEARRFPGHVRLERVIVDLARKLAARRVVEPVQQAAEPCDRQGAGLAVERDVLECQFRPRRQAKGDIHLAMNMAESLDVLQRGLDQVRLHVDWQCGREIEIRDRELCLL